MLVVLPRPILQRGEGLIKHGHALVAAPDLHGHGLHAGLVGHVELNVLQKAHAAGEFGIHAHGGAAQVAHEKICTGPGKRQDQQHGNDGQPG